jgi:transposase
MDAKDKRIAELEALLKAALDKITILEARIAKLEKNSSTSSKPPSSDIVKPPKQRKDKKRRRKIGAQKGHQAHQRQPFTDDQIDQTVEIKLDSCPKCKGKLTVTEQAPKIFQQVELVGRNFIVTAYFCLTSHCEDCQRLFTAKLPPETKTGLFGVKMIAFTAYLKGRCHMSYTTLRDFYCDVFSIKVSTGFLAKQIRKVSKALKKPYEELLEQLPKEPHLHVDESGHKENGKLGWTWCFRGKKFTLFHIDKSRGSAVLEDILGKEYAGVLSSDFYSAYRKYLRLSLVRPQYCWAHLVREVRYLAERKVRKVSNYGKRLLSAIQDMFSTYHRRGKLLDRTWFRRMYSHREEILKVAWRRLPEDKESANIAERLWNQQEGYFRFIDLGIPPTNNLAEQSIRQVVIDRKITQGTRSDWGSRWQERIWSVLSTCAQTGRNILAFLRDSMSSMFYGSKSPTLLEK